MKHSIPPGALDKHIGFLGSTGSGKTSTIKSTIIEPALANKERCIIFDPTSAYWGLRLKADGTSKGYPIYIFGGNHADYPLRAQDGEVLADAFSKSSDSVIFDVGTMTGSDRTRFFTTFAEAILRKNRGAVRMIIDEAHLFMPQAGARAGGMAPDMLHAGNNLVSLGRSRGFRIVLSSQRPAKLHKDALSQVLTLVAMRMMIPNDRAAVKEWIDGQGDPAKSKEIIDSLAKLQPGEAWVWAPLEDHLARTMFPMPKTFDSSKAPDMADEEGPQLSPLNLNALKERLTTVEAEVKANDPRELKARIRELETRLNTATGTTQVTTEALRDAEIDGFTAGLKIGFEGGFAQGYNRAMDDVHRFTTDKTPPETPAEVPADLLAEIRNDAEDREKSIRAKFEQIQIAVEPGLKAVVDRAMKQNVSIGGGMKRILIALAQVYPNALGRRALGMRAHLSSTSGSFDTYMSTLRKQGLIEGSGDVIKITSDGVKNVGHVPPLPTGRELLEYWKGFVGAGSGMGRILQFLYDYPKHEMSRADLAAAVGMSANSGSMDTYLSKLTTLNLITRTSGRVGLSEELI